MEIDLGNGYRWIDTKGVGVHVVGVSVGKHEESKDDWMLAKQGVIEFDSEVQIAHCMKAIRRMTMTQG